MIRPVIEETKVNPSDLDEIIIGNQHSAGQGPSIARRAQLEAGLPVEVPATTINMQCGSGLKSLIFGYYAIRSGSDLVLCGGVENMSQVPFILTNKARKGVKMGNEAIQVEDSLYCDGLIDQFHHYLMGMTAENVAEQDGITREEQDQFAVISQTRACAAIESGRFDEEIVPIIYKDRKGNELVMSRDESNTPGTTFESLSRLRTAFKKDGTVTAGNASQLNDGAAVLLLASEEAVKKYGWKPEAEILSQATVGINPAIMGLGPVNAIVKALQEAKLNLREIDLIELNEAFAAQSVACIKRLAVQYSMEVDDITIKTNVNGGAIALGHPVAASGSRIMVTLLHEMKKRNLQYGLASLCVGGGMGTAMVVKRCEEA